MSRSRAIASPTEGAYRPMLMTMHEAYPQFAGDWQARDLLSVDDLTPDELHHLLALCRFYAGFARAGDPAPGRLAGKTQINLFFEDSTRTNLSFELAGVKLGADVLNVPVAASSVNKGETLIDTAQTLAAMGAHAMIARHKERGVHRSLANRLACPVINAGDGAGEHPTQALLDAATILDAFGRIEGLTIAICGDARHSRVAGSDARLLTRLGAKLRFVGPDHLMPDNHQFPDIPRIDNLKDGLADAHIAMGLRMQFERMGDARGDTNSKARRSDEAARAYFEAFGLTHDTIRIARPGAKIMHPGPMNRGVEIEGALADDPERSLILSQVFHGVPMRMAVLDAFVNLAPPKAGLKEK